MGRKQTLRKCPEWVERGPLPVSLASASIAAMNDRQGSSGQGIEKVFRTEELVPIYEGTALKKVIGLLGRHEGKRHGVMSKQLLAALVLSLGSPALAGQPYVGIEVGSGRVRASDVDETVEYTSTPGGASTLFYDDVFSARWDRTFDVGVVAGYDFGWFRMEGELAQKRAPIGHHANDEGGDQFLSDLNNNLNRPSQAPDPGAPGLPSLTLADFQPSGIVKVRSAMVNGIIDVKPIDRLNVYAGVGVGWSFPNGFDDHDSTGAWQRIFGARYGLGDRIDLGVRYRNFRTGVIKLVHNPIDYVGNPHLVGSSATQTTNVSVTPDIEGQFRAKSLSITLNYNLR